MRFYTIQSENILIADTEQALTRFYGDVFELPEDYEEGKYIIGEKEIEIDVPDYDEYGNPIMIEYEDTETVVDYSDDGQAIGTHEIIVIKHKQQTHTETKNVKVLVPNPDWEVEKAKRERERLDMLSLTKREVFLALYKDKGITPDQLRAQITDTQALIEFDYANDYYRGNPLINGIGAMLGYTPSELDYLFEHKEFEEKE